MSWRDDILIPQLRVDEGVRPFPYPDSVGKITIGVGRNLSDVGLHPGEIELLLTNDVTDAEAICRRICPDFDRLSDVRKSVVANMAFNLGPRLFAFKDTFAAINAGNWTLASQKMLNSKWADQVGARALRLSYQLRSDKL